MNQNPTQSQTQDQPQQTKSGFLGTMNQFNKVLSAKSKDPMSTFGDRKIVGLFTTLNKNMLDFTKEIKKFNIYNKPSFLRKENTNELMLKELRDINKLEKENTKILKNGFMKKAGSILGFAAGIIEFAAIATMLNALLTTDNKFIKPIKDGIFSFIRTIGGFLKEGVDWWWNKAGGKETFTKTIPQIFNSIVDGFNVWYDGGGRKKIEDTASKIMNALFNYIKDPKNWKTIGVVGATVGAAAVLKNPVTAVASAIGIINAVSSIAKHFKTNKHSAIGANGSETIIDSAGKVRYAKGAIVDGVKVGGQFVAKEATETVAKTAAKTITNVALKKGAAVAASKLAAKSLGVLGGGAATAAIILATGGTAQEAAGAAVGTTAGAALGGTIAGILGSVVPVAGTAAGLAIGNVAGGIVGGYVGEKLGGLFNKKEKSDTALTDATDKNTMATIANATAINNNTNGTDNTSFNIATGGIGVGSSSSNYDPLIQKYASNNGLDPLLLKAVIAQESRGNPLAKSGADAGGLMQLTPDTARGLGVSDVYDPEQNIQGGSKYLRQLLNMPGIKNDKHPMEAAISSYNMGYGNWLEVKKLYGDDWINNLGSPVMSLGKKGNKFQTGQSALKERAGYLSGVQDFKTKLSSGAYTLGQGASGVPTKDNSTPNGISDVISSVGQGASDLVSGGLDEMIKGVVAARMGIRQSLLGMSKEDAMKNLPSEYLPQEEKAEPPAVTIDQASIDAQAKANAEALKEIWTPPWAAPATPVVAYNYLR